ncbi:hypothetical protein AC244_28885 [Ensifer adhaerens]|uniref:Uncharacterized protein n=1 Tax=Ensifer adhaerens TaxID=106592 RepID=A0A0L8BH73_ENSAD|nr:hypothetical protein AC244_28885 [Ensifer adhaerens]
MPADTEAGPSQLRTASHRRSMAVMPIVTILANNQSRIHKPNIPIFIWYRAAQRHNIRSSRPRDEEILLL